MKLSPLNPLLLGPVLTGCGLRPHDLPSEPPPLVDMQEPLELFAEPSDEEARLALPLGGFTGATVGDSRDSLDALLGSAEGVLVVDVVLNSPADAAGIQPGDLLLQAGPEGQPPRPLKHPSEWRQLELESAPGQRLVVLLDRAGVRAQTKIEVEARLHAPERGTVQRLREEERVGVVVRTATEVEARAAGLGPGGGAVVVGLSQQSPWRAAGIRYGDLLVSVGGQTVTHPEVVLDAIRAAEGDELEVVWLRDGQRHQTRAALSRRERQVREVYVPLLFSRLRERDRVTTSALLGLYQHVSTPAASRTRLLWVLRFGRGDSDRLMEVP